MKQMKDKFDFSEYNKNHPLFSTDNKKVVGKFKDETSSVPIQEFVGLRSKMYAFRVLDKNKNKVIDHKKLKGIKKNVIKKEITFDNYHTSLLGETKDDIQQRSSFNCIRSFNHELYSINVPKISITSNDDKRFQLNHIDTYAYGHYKIKNLI